MEEVKKMDKQAIRTRYLGIRNGLSYSEREQKSREIWKLLKEDETFQKAQAVLVYMDYRSEVMTTGLVEELLSEGGKKVYAPKVDGMNILFYEITSMEDLQPGYQGIREPVEKEERLYDSKMAGKDGIILVPGAVFDRQRSRMGYGKGFYDRFLSKNPGLFSAALAFECQIARKIPVEPHDIKLDMIVTEKERIR